MFLSGNYFYKYFYLLKKLNQLYSWSCIWCSAGLLMPSSLHLMGDFFLSSMSTFMVIVLFRRIPETNSHTISVFCISLTCRVKG